MVVCAVARPVQGVAETLIFSDLSVVIGARFSGHSVCQLFVNEVI
jgi:hypothetical protein